MRSGISGSFEGERSKFSVFSFQKMEFGPESRHDVDVHALTVGIGTKHNKPYRQSLKTENCFLPPYAARRIDAELAPALARTALRSSSSYRTGCP